MDKEVNILVTRINILVNFFVIGLPLMSALALIYKFLPNVDIAWRDVRVGPAMTQVMVTSRSECTTPRIS